MAAVDYFLKIDGVDGESTDDKHKGSIDIESWSFGLSNSGSASSSGASAGKAAFEDFSFTTGVSKASPKLFLACASGEHIKQAVLTCRKAGGGQQEFYVVKMTDVLISSYQASGAASSETVPVDSFSLNYAKIEIEYRPQNRDGSLDAPVKAGWDLKKNTKL